LDCKEIGMTMTIVKSSDDTNGKSLEMEWLLAPRPGSPPIHIHPKAIETYEILDGEMEFFLREKGERFWTDLGQAAFLFGSILWLASIAFRATATISAAQETHSTGIAPGWFESMRSWSGAMFAVY
jgi:hypothetical protein